MNYVTFVGSHLSCYWTFFDMHALRIMRKRAEEEGSAWNMFDLVHDGRMTQFTVSVNHQSVARKRSLLFECLWAVLWNGHGHTYLCFVLSCVAMKSWAFIFSMRVMVVLSQCRIDNTEAFTILAMDKICLSDQWVPPRLANAKVCLSFVGSCLYLSIDCMLRMWLIFLDSKLGGKKGCIWIAEFVRHVVEERRNLGSGVKIQKILDPADEGTALQRFEALAGGWASLFVRVHWSRRGNRAFLPRVGECSPG